MNPARSAEWALIYKLLANLLAAGYSPAESMAQLMQQSPSRRLQRRLQPWLATLPPGASLAYYLKLPAFELDGATIDLFEKTPQVDEQVNLLHALAARHSQALWVDRLRGASLYWSLAYLFFGGFVASIITIFVLPAFAGFYESFGSALPVRADLLLAIGNFIMPVVLVLALVVIVVRLRPVGLRPAIDRLRLLSPLGVFVKKIALARFTHMLALLLSKNLPAGQAIIVAIAAADNVPLQRRLISDFVPTPAGFAASTADTLQSCSLVPADFIAALRIAEKTGKLRETMPELMDTRAGLLVRYMNLSNNITDTIVKISTAMILAWIAAAVYGPILKVGSMI
jgi:type II secretory pathway component PulF